MGPFSGMRCADCVFIRPGSLLATTLLYLVIWGFAGFSKVAGGMPAYFPDLFGPTLLGTFPGLAATFWMLTFAELAAFALCVISLARLEFLRDTLWLSRMLVWSLFVFLMLGFGQWLTNEFNGAFQQFCYFAGTLVALAHVDRLTRRA